jgi:hypothetical protein
MTRLSSPAGAIQSENRLYPGPRNLDGRKFPRDDFPMRAQKRLRAVVPSDPPGGLLKRDRRLSPGLIVAVDKPLRPRLVGIIGAVERLATSTRPAGRPRGTVPFLGRGCRRGGVCLFRHTVRCNPAKIGFALPKRLYTIFGCRRHARAPCSRHRTQPGREGRCHRPADNPTAVHRARPRDRESLTPARPATDINRATRLRPTRMPLAARSTNARRPINAARCLKLIERYVGSRVPRTAPINDS